MQLVLSGYYGYDNAGDEAVLSSILSHISAQKPGVEFVVTSGAPAQTEAMHASPNGASEYSLRAVARDDFKTLWKEIKACDAFVSGGGSLLQDVTSLRNIVYYIGLIRLAQFTRKPVMIYAQGIGPLQKPLSQKITAAALNHRKTIISVRDPESKALLQKIGVRQNIEITADPVWALEPANQNTTRQKSKSKNQSPIWCVSLRTWLHKSTPDAENRLLNAIRAAAKIHNATLKFLAMQPERDRALMESLGVANHEILETENRHPREIMALAGECDLMIAMRLHALIFAAAQGVPCIAVSYDPKVASLAKLLGAPVISDASESELAKLQASNSVAAPNAAFVAEMQTKARRNAELAIQVLSS